MISTAMPEAPTHPRPIRGAADAARPGHAERLALAERLGATLAELVGDPPAFAAALRTAFAELAEPGYRAGQQRVAPGIGLTHGVRLPYQAALRRALRKATWNDPASVLILLADRLIGEPELEARWLALSILERTVITDPERSWQLLRRAARDASDWITVDTLAHPCGKGVLREHYRWAELEQLTISPSRWERRLVGSTIATIPFVDRTAGRAPGVAAQALPLLGLLMGDREPDVQKALAWAYRSLTLVDAPATTAALDAETTIAADAADGNRAWVIRDVLPKLAPADATRLRARLDGIRRRPGGPSTSPAAELAERFAGMGLGRAMPEPPLT